MMESDIEADKNMMSRSSLISAFSKIRAKQLDIETFVKSVVADGNKEEILTSIRKLMVDEEFAEELSVICGIVKELDDRESIPILWKLISDESSKGRRASLVYAMEDMNPIENLEELVDLIANDNYEVLCNAMNTINNMDGTVDAETIDKCIKKVKCALIKSQPEWREKALHLLLAELECDQ